MKFKYFRPYLSLISACIFFVQVASSQETDTRAFLQVGAYADESNARVIEKRLSDAGVKNILVQDVQVAGKTVFRVRVGPLDESPVERAALVDQLRALGISDAILLQAPVSLAEFDKARGTFENRIDARLIAQNDASPSSQISATNSEPFRLPSLDPVPANDIGQLSQISNLYVRRIEVRGVSAFDDAEIATITGPYVNREVSSAELQELRVALSRNYVQHQFINSGVILPDQQVVNGVVTYEAIEGKLTRIEIDGEHHLDQRYVDDRLRRYLGEPLNFSEIQYALQYLQNDPNVERLDARFGPGAELGESVLRVAIDEPPRFRAGLGIDNHSSSSTGAEQAIAYFSSRNLTGFAESLNLSLGVSDGADNYSAQFEMPITRRNTKIQIYGYRSDSSIVEDRFQVLDIDNQTDTFGASLTQPFIDNLNTTLSMTLGFESKHSESKLLGLPFSFSPGAQGGESDTNVAQLAFDWVTRGSNHVFTLRGNYRNGMDTGDATVFAPEDAMDMLANPTGADGVFDVFQAQMLYLYRLNALSLFSNLHERGQLVFRTTAQFSNDPLMSLEKMAIGGVNTVRGYPENLLVRDNGVAATVELQLPIPGYRSTPHPRNLLVVPFFDYGRSWDKTDTDPNPMRNTDDAKYVVGLGLGLVWAPVTGLQAQVFWGADIGDNFSAADDPRIFRSSDLQDDGLHFSVNYSYGW